MYSKTLLAIDTATDQAGIALYDGSCLDEVAWTTCYDQTVNMLSQIDHLIHRVGVEISQIGAVAVTIGPGRFTALRVGLSIAKGLALAQDADVIGIPTLDAIAWPYQLRICSTVAVVAAGRKRYAWSAYVLDEDGYRASEINSGPASELAKWVRKLDNPVVVTGEVGEDVVELLAGLPGIVVAPMSGRLGRAGAAAEIGWSRWLAGEVNDPVSLSPTYLHPQRQPTSG